MRICINEDNFGGLVVIGNSFTGLKGKLQISQKGDILSIALIGSLCIALLCAQPLI